MSSNGLRRRLGLFLPAVVLWAGMNVCWMPVAECGRPKNPPCHGTSSKDSHPPADGCCGGSHMSPASTPSAAPLLETASQQSFDFFLPAVATLPEAFHRRIGLRSPVLSAFHSPPLNQSLGRAPPA